MKKLTIVLILLSIGNFAIAQKSNKKNKETAPVVEEVKVDETGHMLEIYQMGLDYGDYEVAKSAIFHILALHPEKTFYLDSLARIYYAMSAFPQALKAVETYFEAGEYSDDMLEIKAASQRGMNMNKESLDSYEKLYGNTKDLYHAYQVAVLQYSLKRMGECIGTIGAIQNDPESEKAEIAINYGQGMGQNVPMRAALENLKGVINIELNVKDAAKKNFEEALKIFPDFELAKNNLESLAEKPAESEKK